MKISVDRETFLTQLQMASRVASTRSAIQALSGIQVVASEDGSELRATDMDVSLRIPIEAQIVRPGTVVLPARLLLDVVRSLPTSSVSLDEETTHLIQYQHAYQAAARVISVVDGMLDTLINHTLI